jgi:lipid II:glycine glycyltransferase (peptidoglycan interpeptide bridge formation enzyme)
MGNKEQYRKICEQNKNVPVFAQAWWLDVVCPQWDVAIAKKGDHVSGVWPYPIEKKMGVTLLRTPMLTPYLGPVVFFPPDIKESKADSFEHDTIAELIDQIPDRKVWHLAIQPGIKQAGLFKKHHLHPQVQQTFLLELHETEETLLANMKEATRRNIRAAESEITICEAPDCLKDLYDFQKNTLNKKGKAPAYTLAHLQKIMDACNAHNASALWAARDAAGKLQAMVWQVWDEKCSYYFLGGQNPEAHSYRAVSLLLWHTIKEAKKRGNTVFDLEGSMDEGVERFFRNFGGDRSLYIVLQKNKSLVWKLKQMVRG